MTTKRKRYPSFDKLIDAVDEIAELLIEKDGGDAAIVGGLAMQFYGSPRLTNDVDLIASSADSLRGFTEPLSFGGRRGRASNKVEVDVIVRNDKWTDLYAAALNSAEVIEDAPIAIARPEYLLVMKMIARRDKDEQDVMFLLTEDVIDCQRCRKIVEKFLGAYAVDDFDALCEEAEWLKQKGKRR